MQGFDAEARRAVLSRSALLREMAPRDLDAVLARVVTRQIARGEFILHRGDPSLGMFVIAAGRVRISLVSEEGKEVALSVLGPGETLGEMSLLDGEDCSADASAQEDCVLFLIERAQFLRMLRGNVDFCIRMLAILTGRLRRANAAIEDIALLDLPTRLGRLLLRLARDYGVRKADGLRIEVKLSQRDLSTLVGSSREKVNRQLRKWEKERVLGKDGGRIVVMQPAALGSLD